jgi:hypothetical protein
VSTQTAVITVRLKVTLRSLARKVRLKTTNRGANWRHLLSPSFVV